MGSRVKFRERFILITIVLLGILPMTIVLLSSNIQVIYVDDFSIQRKERTLSHLEQNDGGSSSNYNSSETDKLLKIYQSRVNSSSPFWLNVTERYTTFLTRLDSLRKTGARLHAYLNNTGTTWWEKFYRDINQYYLYNPHYGTALQEVLTNLSKRAIIKTKEKAGGTQLKWILTFDDGGEAIFKPMRFPREQETLPNHFYFHDIERHTAEIAAFHLDRILGFYRTPPTIGRVLNIKEEILQVRDAKEKHRHFISPAGNICIYGNCSQYCKSPHAVCGQPDRLEGSLSIYLPHRNGINIIRYFHPWRRTYSEKRVAPWEANHKLDYCDARVRKLPEYQNGRRLLDLMDMAVFDYLIGNMDRHHYGTFEEFDVDTFLIHFDHGRGFGKSKSDCPSCLAPVRQCCVIRLSTLAKLVKLFQGPDSLSSLMRVSLNKDPVAPVLLEAHLDALDRRVGKILVTVLECMQRGNSWDTVVADDGAM